MRVGVASMENKGRVISWSIAGNSNLLENLRSFYGLDIRRISRTKWCLVGEWFGKVYVDYLAEATKDEKY